MLGRGPQILANRGDLDPNCGKVRQSLFDFVATLPQSHHQAGLGGEARCTATSQDGQTPKIASRRAYRVLKAGHGLDVVIQDIGPGIQNELEGSHITLDVTDQDFNLRVRLALANGANGLGNRAGATIFKVVTSNTRDDGVGKIQSDHGLSHTGRFGGVERHWLTGVDETETTGSSAPLTIYHEGGCAVLPALEDIRAARLFAHGHQS